MKVVLAIALGGALGAVGGHFVSSQLLRLLGSHFPWGTLTVNIVGSLMMGALIELMALKIQVSPAVRAFRTVGLLGGFTTFSAFSLEVAVLYERGAAGLALAYVLVSLIAAVGGLFRRALACARGARLKAPPGRRQAAALRACLPAHANGLFG